MAQVRPFTTEPDHDTLRSEAEAQGGARQLDKVFEATIIEGEHRLTRSWPALLATGAVGGIDVSIGVLGLLVVEHATHSPLLAALAFSIGFIALTLAQSELFTENFLVPVVAVAAGRAGPLAVLRLWAGTATLNMLGGWVFTGLMLTALPELRSSAVDAARHYIELPADRALAAAVLGGVVITLMTWMERGTESVVGKLAAAVGAAFLLVAATLNHAIVVSLLCFAALHAGAPFGYADWLHTLALACVGNIVGGVGLVTFLRLIQLGSDRVSQAREDALRERTT
jgi:formate-nitrite transporter family protein